MAKAQLITLVSSTWGGVVHGAYHFSGTLDFGDKRKEEWCNVPFSDYTKVETVWEERERKKYIAAERRTAKHLGVEFDDILMPEEGVKHSRFHSLQHLHTEALKVVKERLGDKPFILFDANQHDNFMNPDDVVGHQGVPEAKIKRLVRIKADYEKAYGDGREPTDPEGCRTAESDWEKVLKTIGAKQ